MLNIYKTVENSLIKINDFEEGSWIDLINPTPQELKIVCDKIGVDIDFLKGPLDDEESSRIETDEGQIFILVDIPLEEKEDGLLVYSTIPVGIVTYGKYIITICLKDNHVLREFKQNNIKSFFTYKRTRFLLQLLFRIDVRYLLYLKHIDKMSDRIQTQLHKSMKNKELIQLLDLEKSLVYFSTSLKGNQIVLEKLLKLEALKLYPEDQDLLEDVIIENKQAIEMATIYSNILSGMMDAYASVISNNLNIVMKVLTSITIVLSIPTMFASFYGMNVNLPFQNSPYAFPLVGGISVVIASIVAIFLYKRNMF